MSRVHFLHPCRTPKAFCGVKGAPRLTPFREQATCLRCRGRTGWNARKKKSQDPVRSPG